MSLPLAVPVTIKIGDKTHHIDQNLSQLLQEILRRAVDGSTNPIFITGGDIKITLSGNGIIFTAASGNTWRLNVQEQTNDDGSVYAVPFLNRVT